MRNQNLGVGGFDPTPPTQNFVPAHLGSLDKEGNTCKNVQMEARTKKEVKKEKRIHHNGKRDMG